MRPCWPTCSRLGAPRLGSEPQLLASLLALCGGPEAGAYLRRYYDARLLPEEFDPPQLGHLCGPEAYEVQALGEGYESQLVSRNFRDSVRAEAGGVTYELRTGNWLRSPRELYVAVDSDGDYNPEELLVTGLSDMFFQQMHFGLPEEVKWHSPLSLKVEGNTLTIGHHVPIFTQSTYGRDDAYVSLEFTDTHFVYDELSLPVLRADSDGGGLTDMYEQRLGTDPLAADTDADGIVDRRDRLPNLRPADFGPEQRAIVRALQFRALTGRVWRPDPFGDCHTPQPPAALYLRGRQPCGLAYANNYTVYLDEMQEAALNAPGPYEADTWWLGFDATLPEEPTAPLLRPDRIAGTVGASYTTNGEDTTLVLIDGEYYPVQNYVTWII
jgi:hypothetical protein